MTHEEMEELVPLLALDALSAPEEIQVRTHVESCETCATLLRDHLETAADLALLAGPAAPPAGLKGRLMDEISRDEAPEPDRVSAAGAPAPQPHDDDAGDAERQPWWQRFGVGLAAAAVLLVGVALVAYYQVVPGAQRQDTILEVVAGNTPTLVMRPTEQGSQAVGRVFEKGGKAAIRLDGLDRDAKGVYELWAIEGGEPTPLTAVEDRDWLDAPGKAIVLLEDGLGSADGVALSLEPSEPSGPDAKPKGPVLLAS